MFDLIAYAVIFLLGAACLVVALGVLLSPVYFWMLWHDSATEDKRKRDLREALELLRT